jgi:protein-L-isoaspartate(D-aspartate) O-methyltransferase
MRLGDQMWASEIPVERMIREQIIARGLDDPRVLGALRSVPREAFLPADQVMHAHEDKALAVGLGQTISQPYIVAYMTQMLDVAGHHRVLEIGTGTGYQTAVLSKLALRVFSVERLEAFLPATRGRLDRLGIFNIEIHVGDGSGGWPAHAPYDRIMVTAAAPTVPSALVDQLAEGGKMIIPVGSEETQRLLLIERREQRWIETPLIRVRFVRLLGAYGYGAG